MIIENRNKSSVISNFTASSVITDMLLPNFKNKSVYVVSKYLYCIKKRYNLIDTHLALTPIILDISTLFTDKLLSFFRSRIKIKNYVYLTFNYKGINVFINKSNANPMNFDKYIKLTIISK